MVMIFFEDKKGSTIISKKRLEFQGRKVKYADHSIVVYEEGVYCSTNRRLT